MEGNGRYNPGGDQRRTGVWVAIGLLLLVFGFTLVLTLPTYASIRGNPFWFVGMLVIFGAALALMAVVFTWLGLAAKDEAFGLPAGSVRSMLAIGVMVLFAVFGLQALSGEGPTIKPATQPLATVVLTDAAQARAEIERYEKAGLLAVAGAASGVQGTSLSIYAVTRETPAAAQESQKQIITALITLVTSVVSFYFGSRSVEAMAKGMSGGGGPGGVMPRVTEQELKRLDDAIGKAEAGIAGLAGQEPTSGTAEELARVVSALQAALKKLKDERASLDALSKDAVSGSATFEQVDQRSKQLAAQLQLLQQDLAAAQSRVAKG